MAEHTPEPSRIIHEDVVSDYHTYAGLIAAVYDGGREPGPEGDAEKRANLYLIRAAAEQNAALRDLTRIVESRFEGLEIVALVPGELRRAVTAAKQALASALIPAPATPATEAAR